MSTFINEMVDGRSTISLTSHIQNTLIPTYSRRHKLLLSAVLQYLVPLGIIPPANQYNVGGGFFLWLELPKALTSTDVVTAARQDGVLIAYGTVSALPEGNDALSDYRDYIRLCFAWADEDRLAEGVIILAGTLKRLLGHEGLSNGR